MLFIPSYFSPIIQYVFILKNENILFEVEDNYQKQTYRNRCRIYGANGMLTLSIPTIHNGKQKTKDVKIDYKSAWHKQHLKSLESAYYSSPFFEFYIDELKLVYVQKTTYLLDFNLKCHEFIMDALQENNVHLKTKSYEIKPITKDYRNLVNAKKEFPTNLKKYTQVFDNKHGFISNLSILDLLFMKGPNTETYLKSIY